MDSVRDMTTAVDPDQLDWFRGWTARASAAGPREVITLYVPEQFGRVVVVRHPGTVVVEVGPGHVPFRGHPGEEGEPAPFQKWPLERLLVEVSGASAPATLASYDPRPDQPGRLQAEATRVPDPNHIDYLLVGGMLAELTYTAWEARFDEEQPLTVLWPNDRRWWLHSDPDSSFTVVGCDDDVAERLLAEPVLLPVEWPGRSSR